MLCITASNVVAKKRARAWRARKMQMTLLSLHPDFGDPLEFTEDGKNVHDDL